MLRSKNRHRGRHCAILWRIEMCNQMQHIPRYCHSFLYPIINNGFEMAMYFKLISVLQFHPILVSWSIIQLKLIKQHYIWNVKILRKGQSWPVFNRFKSKKKSSSSSFFSIFSLDRYFKRFFEKILFIFWNKFRHIVVQYFFTKFLTIQITNNNLGKNLIIF